jgi:glycosyltransferase involved in cell wall biosynthesis
VRVLLAHNRYRSFGGEERHVDLLEEGLQQAGVETRRFERASVEAGDTIVRRLSIGLGMTYRPSSARAIRGVLRTWKPDVVHVHNLLPLLTPSILRESKRHGAVVVLTTHNYRLFCPAGGLVRQGEVHDDCVEGSSLACGLRNARDSWAESIAYGLAIELQRRLRLVERWVDAYVTPSAFLGRLLVQAGFPAERVRLIRYGVRVPSWSRTIPEFALYAGRLTDEKGVRTLVQASRLAPEVPLVIAGDGPLASEVHAAANGAIRYAGFLPADALGQFRAKAAFAVVPSEYPDVLPFAALEALAEGTPVITSDRGGLPEIARDGAGVVVPAGDAEALASAMRQLWRRSQNEPDFGRSAWESANRRFSLEAQTDRLIELYGELARKMKVARG